jgi:hypothetical protein
MSSETTTPNIGLQVPAFNQPNWQTPLNYDLNKLDLIFGGEVQVPALSVATFTIANVAALLVPYFKSEQPAGAIPGTSYTLSYAPVLLIGLFVNGLLLRPGLDYLVSGLVVTLAAGTTSSTDTVWTVYLWQPD